MSISTRIRTLLAACAILLAPATKAQLSFTNANNKIAGPMYSGCAVTVTDVNFDGLDDILRMDQGHNVSLELQNRDGSFSNHYLTSIGSGSAWAMTCADVDHNGWKDMIADGNSGIELVKIFESGGNITSTTTTLPNSGFFLQNATFCDMNNDGWIDLFCCDDNAVSKLYVNDGSGNLFPSTIVNFAINPGINYNGDPADSGNYGSCWIDFDNDHDLDLYVAHCRQSTSSPTDLRRINRLFVNDGNNNFTEAAGTYGIDIGWQTWTASFGDIDNDGDLDLLLTNHDHTSQIFENDGTGHYTELTGTGFNTNTITPIESVFEDFDNDGYIDILVTGDEWVYYKNNGDKTFSQVSGLMANNGMLSFAIGDLNHDGFVDVYASYGDIYTNPTNIPDVLYLNNGNSNRFINFQLEGAASNKGAIGGRATIYGDFGVQVREVRAGESYGTCNSSQLHFGLGNVARVDSAVIWFPSGYSTTLYNLESNQFVTVKENSCVIAGNFVTGSSVLCTGQTTTLNAMNGFASYDWSTGDNTQSIQVSAEGTYNVMVTDNTGCTNISPNFTVQLNPDETPSVTASGELNICQGNAVTLTSSVAVAYNWSNGNSGQSISVDQTGDYSVTIQGVCGSFTSDPVHVEVLPAPAPSATGAAASGPASVTLNAVGSDLYWYDQQSGGNLLGQGASYVTPMINAPTTYWVEDRVLYPGALSYTGMPYHQGTEYSGTNTNGTVDFNVLDNCTVVSVKVYTDTPGLREFQLLDGGGNVVNSVQVNLPADTTRVNLNFSITPGTGYRLTTNASINQSTLGTTTPRLKRSSLGVAYPYTINNVISITGSNQGQNYYYYFYDWEVQEPGLVCVSERTPVLADITTAVGELAANSGLSVFPNPATSFLNIRSEKAGDVNVRIYDAAARLLRQDSFRGISHQVSIEDLASGIYILHLEKEGAVYQYRLTVN